MEAVFRSQGHRELVQKHLKLVDETPHMGLTPGLRAVRRKGSLKISSVIEKT